MPKHDGSTSKRDVIAEAAEDAGVSKGVAAAFYPLWWLWEHRVKLGGVLMVVLGLVLALWLGHDTVAYLKADRKVTTDAELVTTIEEERYNRKTKEYTTYYDNYYRFYVNDEPQEWMERSEHPGDETRHLRIWWGEDGQWHRFELGRWAIAAVALVVIGVALILFA
jgi:hypothetical protein